MKKIVLKVVKQCVATDGVEYFQIYFTLYNYLNYVQIYFTMKQL